MTRRNVVEAPPEPITVHGVAPIEGDLLTTTGTAIAEYSETEVALAEMRQAMADKVWDLTTTAGNQEARQTRLQLVKLRSALDSKRLELKRPLLDQGKLLDDEAKRIAAEILAMEEPLDRLIKADEKRRDEERAERERAEAERLQVINEKIAHIANAPLVYIGAEAKMLMEVIEAIEARDLVVEFDDIHLPRAEEARTTALALLRTNLTARLAADAQAAENAKALAKIERDRVIDRALITIMNTPSRFVGKSAAEIAGALQAISAEAVTEAQYGDRLPDAQHARTNAINTLKDMHTSTLAAEVRAGEQARLQADWDAQQAEVQQRQQAERLKAERDAAMAERIATIRGQVKYAEGLSVEQIERTTGILREARNSVDPDEVAEWPELIAAFNDTLGELKVIIHRKMDDLHREQEAERQAAEARLLRIENATLREAGQAALDYFDDVDASEDPELIAEMLRSALAKPEPAKRAKAGGQ